MLKINGRYAGQILKEKNVKVVDGELPGTICGIYNYRSFEIVLDSKCGNDYGVFLHEITHLVQFRRGIKTFAHWKGEIPREHLSFYQDYYKETPYMMEYERQAFQASQNEAELLIALEQMPSITIIDRALNWPANLVIILFIVLCFCYIKKEF